MDFITRLPRRLHRRSVLLLAILLVFFCILNFKFHSSVRQSSNNNRAFEATHSNYWVRISDDVYVYSAFMDERGPGESHIKIIGIKRMERNAKAPPRPSVQDITKVQDVSDIQSKYECKLFYNENGRFKGIKSNKLTYFVFEEGVKEFVGVFYKCFFPLQLSPLPNTTELYISLRPKNVKGYPDKLVWVRRKRIQSNLSICVRPLFGPLDDLESLAQFLAYYESMGVERFTFYDLSIAPQVRHYLQTLENVQLFKWNLPTGNTSELWDYGTLTALHDCMYQTKGFTIVVDLDEFVIPQIHASLSDFLATRKYEKFNELVLRNVFFCLELCQNWNSSRTDMQFPIFSCPLRMKRIWGVHHRSKYIARAEKIVSVGHHFVTTYLNSSDPRHSDLTAYILPSVALLGHYRRCGPIFGKRRPFTKFSNIRDDHLMSFKSKMEQSNANQVYRQLVAVEA